MEEERKENTRFIRNISWEYTDHGRNMRTLPIGVLTVRPGQNLDRNKDLNEKLDNFIFSKASDCEFENLQAVRTKLEDEVLNFVFQGAGRRL